MTRLEETRNESLLETKFSNAMKKEEMKKHKTTISNSSLEKAIVTYDKMIDKGIIKKRESNILSLTQSLEKNISFNI